MAIYTNQRAVTGSFVVANATTNLTTINFRIMASTTLKKLDLVYTSASVCYDRHLSLYLSKKIPMSVRVVQLSSSHHIHRRGFGYQP